MSYLASKSSGSYHGLEQLDEEIAIVCKADDIVTIMKVVDFEGAKPN